MKGMKNMRLWHQSLISKLPRQQLLGQHRELCALRGKGWGRNHSVVNYVFEYSPARLVAYHYLVMNEMQARGYNPNKIWYDVDYRGSALGDETLWCDSATMLEFLSAAENDNYMIYPEHNDEYLQECIDNLKSKGVEI
jgi:uncharacterized protein (TIGR02328 family)